MSTSSLLNSKSFWMILIGVILEFALAVLDEFLAFRPEVFEYLQYVIAGGFGLGVLRQGFVDIASRGETSGNSPGQQARRDAVAHERRQREFERWVGKLSPDEVEQVLLRHSEPPPPRVSPVIPDPPPPLQSGPAVGAARPDPQGGRATLPTLLLIVLAVLGLGLMSCDVARGLSEAHENQFDAEIQEDRAAARVEDLEAKNVAQEALIADLREQLESAPSEEDRERILAEIEVQEGVVSTLRLDLESAEEDLDRWRASSERWEQLAEQYQTELENRVRDGTEATGSDTAVEYGRVATLLFGVGTAAYAAWRHARRGLI